MQTPSEQRHERFCDALIRGETVFVAAHLAGITLIDPSHAQQFYVYLLIDPRDQSVFYIGKGKNRRFAAHSREWRTGRVVNSRKHRRLKELAEIGHQPTVLLLKNNLGEPEALELELRMIRRLGLRRLTNGTKGQRAPENKMLILVDGWLSRLKPPRQWQAEKPRSPQEIEFYSQIAKILIDARERYRSILGISYGAA